MAKTPAQASRSTEIDVADDLFAGGAAAAPAAAPAGPQLERDEHPIEVAAPPKKERPPLVEPAPEKKPAAAKAAEEADEDEEAGGAGRKRGAKRPSALMYYVVPAAGAALILSMGWTFAFIIRQGLAPRAEAPKAVEQARVLPPKEAPKAPADPRETMKVLAPGPQEPALPSISPGGKGDETDAGKIALEEPFFIPLEGSRRNAREKGPTVFLHLSLTLGVSNQAALREVAGKRSVIREAVFDHFNRMTPQDLASPKGREQAKAALIARLSKEVVQGQVRSVYFEEFFTR
ncbi:MAG: flagellar basal body-associated FliL family protein [Candidatus Tectomicrobia bacterium]|uniref:Flagellar protein FliL n=1 Tax=Tectimicrobiota bacterium TaxID=2528274 RepID=A0A932I0V1_UNCTE|nr:flagellar basal body-associated FliL family protein [Candidatus Tectomicrobia bacterium]